MQLARPSLSQYTKRIGQRTRIRGATYLSYRPVFVPEAAGRELS
jgi:hypothetical protein